MKLRPTFVLVEWYNTYMNISKEECGAYCPTCKDLMEPVQKIKMDGTVLNGIWFYCTSNDCSRDKIDTHYPRLINDMPQHEAQAFFESIGMI